MSSEARSPEGHLKAATARFGVDLEWARESLDRMAQEMSGSVEPRLQKAYAAILRDGLYAGFALSLHWGAEAEAIAQEHCP